MGVRREQLYELRKRSAPGPQGDTTVGALRLRVAEEDCEDDRKLVESLFRQGILGGQIKVSEYGCSIETLEQTRT